MTPDIATLAGTIIGSYLMPYVQRGLKKIAAEVTDQMGKTASDAIWGKVTSIFESKEDKFALSQFEKHYDDASVVNHLIAILTQKLEQDRELYNELAALIEQAVDNTGTGSSSIEQNTQVSGTVEIKHVVIKDVDTVNITAVNNQTMANKQSRATNDE